ncbi:hypothetical protein G9A89_013087 [Geosiphon pyriformis]|nr:hypothetical protein G9A89_013087 [Geosiphon pyriformis]
MGTGVAIIMNTFLARHVSKIEEIPGRVISVRLLFKGKLLVTVLGLYAGVLSGARFNGDFNESGSGKSASFKFCLSLDLVNSFVGYHLADFYTWSNSRGVGKMIDYIFVGGNLSSAIASHQVVSVSDFFDTDHRAVVVSVGLGGLLDVQLNSLHKQDLSSAKLLSLGEMFSGAKIHGNVDAMWAVLVGAVVDFADVTFLKHWFSEFKCSKNIHSSRFFGLEMLVAKIVKKFCSSDLPDTNRLTCAFKNLVDSEVKSDVVVRHLSLVCRDYRRSKMFKSRLAEEVSVRKAIEKRMNNFCSDKGSMIRSVLERLFYKVVLDYLVVDDNLVLLSGESVLPDLWTRQYAPLDYVWNNTFSGIMYTISMGELLSVVGGLPDSKAAGLSGISNELWKHSGEVVLGCLLALFNKCLFVVLKSTFTQSPVFAVGSVIEDVLEKNKELWLVLQDMRKAYDSVGWHHLRASLQRVKMCKRFIRFFGGIHENRVNRVMTDFGLSDGYKVHDGLDQGEVKRHKHLCRYQIDTKFVLKTGRIECGGGLTSYFSAGVFVDDMIWVGNCQASTQYPLNIASKFFVVNDISINSEKMVAIPINQGVKVVSLSICGQPISIARKDEAHWYLGIFLSTEGLSKLSVAKAHTDVRFFVNVVLKKAITDKQFSYLVLAILQPIVNYCIQFSFVPLDVCHKFKTCLSRDFLDTALHHPLLYGLKPFEQMQSKGKIAALIMFSNASGILRHLFSHRFLDLQVLGWASLDLLQFLVRLRVNPVNNFLAGMVKIFLGSELSLVNNLPIVFRSSGRFLLFSFLGKSLYFDSVKSLKCFGIAFGDRLFDKKGILLDPCGSVPYWFMGYSFSDSVSFVRKLSLDILGSGEFFTVKNGLHDIWSGFFEVFMDGSLRNADSAEVICGAAAYFPVLDRSINVAVHGFLSFTIAELQAVALSLECISSSSTMVLYLDSQAAIDVCVSEMSLATPNFCNQCWLEKHHIFNLVRDKDLSVSWVKMKSHSGIPSNVEADLAAGTASGSLFSLFADVREHFLVAEGVAVFGNTCYFVRDIFQSVCCAHWEAGPGCDVVPNVMIGCIDWVVTAKFSTLCTYLMKAVHRRLPMAVRKRLYDKCYPSVLYLLCSGMEFFDHAFTCVHESGVCGEILAETSVHWSALADSFLTSAILQVLSQCSIDVGLYILICKGFVLGEWYEETCGIFEDSKVAAAQIVDYVSHQVVMEKAGLICDGGVVSGLFRGVPSVLSNGVVRLLDVANSFAVSFGHQKPFCFFFGLGGSVQVNISV